MAVLKHIGPGSVFKVTLFLYFLVGIIVAFCLFVVTMAVSPASPYAPVHGALLLIVPIIYGVFGGIVAAIAAFFYNVVAAWVGGVKVEIN